MKVQFEFCSICQKPVDVADQTTMIGFRGLDIGLDEQDYAAAVGRVRARKQKLSRRDRRDYITLAVVVAQEHAAVLSDKDKVLMGRAYEELGAVMTAAHRGCAEREGLA